MQPEPVTRPVGLRDLADGSFLAVRGLSADIVIDGPLVHSRLTITFANDTQRTLQGDLCFPLPPSAALRELSVVCGGRKLTGKLRPRGRAQAEYQRAVDAGHTAALAETEGEDLAHLRIAPIEAGEDVKLTLGVQSTLIPTAEGHRLVVPLTYMPRYVEDPQQQKATERAAVERPRPLTLAARATVRIIVKHPSGRAAPPITCGSHQAAQEQQADHTVLTIGPTPLDRDLHVEVADRPQKAQALWLRYQPSDSSDGLGPTAALALVPPAFADEGPTVPRTVTLLVDRSGSMNGKPMAAALRAVRGCLRALGPSDRFNIIAFDDSLEALARRPLAFSDDSLQAADRFLAGIDARGGTQATRAILAALKDAQDASCRAVIEDAPKLDLAHRLRVVVFMTDGDVAGAEQVLRQAKDKLADTRLHVIGIGEAVQHSLLGELAALGGGTYTPVADDKDLEQALARLKNAIDAPLLTGVQVSIEVDGDHQSVRHLEPAGPLDLFAGRPLLLAWRGELPAGARLLLSGQQQDGEDLKLRVPLNLAQAYDADGAAPLLWALLRNRRLTYRFDSGDDVALEALGTDFGLVNRMVALVAVHGEQRDAQVEASLPVSLPLPASQSQAAPPMPGHLGGSSGAASTRLPAGMKLRGRGSLPGGLPPPAPPPMAAAKPSAAARPPAMAPRPVPAAAPMPPPMSAPQSYAAVSFGGIDDDDVAAPVPMAEAAAVSFGDIDDDDAAAPAPVTPAARMPLSSTAALPPPPPPAVARPRSPQVMTFSDDEAGLRALLLEQAADGLFAGDLGATLAAVAALVGRGHTAREGLFRAELRRTLQALRQRLPGLAGEPQQLAALALALLTMPHGEAAPAELGPAQAATLGGASLRDLPALRRQIAAALAAAPASFRTHPLAQTISRSFQLS